MKLAELGHEHVLVYTQGQIGLPMAVRKALSLKPGMRVDERADLDRVRSDLTPNR